MATGRGTYKCASCNAVFESPRRWCSTCAAGYRTQRATCSRCGSAFVEPPYPRCPICGSGDAERL